MKNLAHFFIPHPETHQKAHLISWRGVLAYILIFILLQTSIQIVSFVQPGVLGISSSVDQKRLIELTNEERAKKGLNTLVENEKLNLAAEAKAKNMFEEDYWAHYSPSGKDPWGFINTAGYKFTYAGENLARNFYNSEDVVSAWMASPTHRDNLLNSKYQEIGIAVVEGVLKGQKTILVVQEFGTPVEAIAAAPDNAKRVRAEVTRELPSKEENSSIVAGQQIGQDFRIDPYQILRVFGFSVITIMFILIMLDIYILRKRAIYRVSSRHVPHMALLTIAGTALINMRPGMIL